MQSRMNTTMLGLLLFMLLGGAPAPAASSFTYQGRLLQSGTAKTATYDFRFALYTAASAGTQIGALQTKAGVAVSNGLFTVTLDFGATAFDGTNRWLEIEVRPAGAGSYTMLAPRQLLNLAPQANYANAAPWSGLKGVPAGFADGVDNDTQYLPGPGLTLSGNNFSLTPGGHNHWGESWMGANTGVKLISTSGVWGAALEAKYEGGNGTGVKGTTAASNMSGGISAPSGVQGVCFIPPVQTGDGKWRAYGVAGWATATSSTGVMGMSPAVGVNGNASASGGIGVWGEATSTGGTGVKGQGAMQGVYGEASDALGVGVKGVGKNQGIGVSGLGYTGVVGVSAVSNGTGLSGECNLGNLAYGVWGKSSSGYAGYFSGKAHVSGDLTVTGSVTKASGSFKIDHPLDPANQYLYHSFVESPDMKNIYDGIAVLDANGRATVTLPDWFQSLNSDFRYQLTCIGGYAPVYIDAEVSNNQFRIAGGRTGLKVSWLVTGIRKDSWARDHRIPVEEPKTAEERGTYLYPQGEGKSAAQGLEAVRMKLREKEAASQATVQTPPKPESQEEMLRRQGLVIVKP